MIKCPYCGESLDNVEATVTQTGKGKLIDEQMIVELDSEDMVALACGYCGAQLPLSLVTSWDWEKQEVSNEV